MNALKDLNLFQWYVIQHLKQKKGKWVFPKEVIQKVFDHLKIFTDPATVVLQNEIFME